MNETILTWIVFILAFGGMVLIHEFGHFIVARLCKIEVEEFGIGLPTPGALTLFTWQGTRFTLNWLPLGGFVRPKGENDPNVPGGLAAASPWKRLAVLFAGPAMNLLTAVLIYSLIFNRVGVPDSTRVLVSSVNEGSPAAQAGFQDGDIFISGNGKPIHSYDDLRLIVDGNKDKPVTFLIDRRGKQIELTATPRLTPLENGSERIMIGVGLGVPFKQSTSPVETINLGARYTYLSIRTLVALPAQMIRGSLDSEQSRLVGLKGIYDILQQTVSHDVQATTTAPASNDPIDQPVRTLELIASLSISLGLFNLFPFPALDGGRILFVLPELIFRRRVSPQLENMVHAAGMAFLLLLMIYINVMDFVNPINVTIP
jgi:regulator of sigma E protease